MKLVVTHEQPDFDALASVALAKLAHPGAVAVLTGTLGRSLRKLTVLYRDELNLQDAGDIDLDKVTELIMVDTADPQRIKPFDQLLDRVPVTIYDHHPVSRGNVTAASGIQEQVGATATLLTRHLQASNTPIPPSIASLALLGIHEDTGNLTYSGSTSADYAAAAHLLKSGANLELVTEFTREPYSAGQRTFLQLIMDNAQVQDDGDNRVLTAACTLDEYVPGASALVNQALELHSADAAIIAAGMAGQTLVFARVFRGYDAAAAFQDAFGAGGHPGAAFARSDLPPAEALDAALAALKRHRSSTITAEDVMTAPVTTIPASSSVAEARQLLLAHGHNGAPVTTTGGQLLGIISRRDIERALRFEMDASAVTGFMTRDVIHAEPGDSLQHIEKLVTSNNIGRLPIIEDDQLIGIVTRTDLLRARHSASSLDSVEQILNRLPAFLTELLDAAGEMLPAGARLYLVGGTVRDALLGRALTDFDLAVEGLKAERLAALLQERYGGTLTHHGVFGTTTLKLPNNLAVDIATARDESYAHPGALPEVQPSDIRHDLDRRDFTINAFALQVQPQPRQLLDPYNGQLDLQKRMLRPLHALSFLDDPTRILRGARLAGRLGFRFTPGTEEQLRLALAPGIIGQVTHARLRNELELLLLETRVEPGVSELARIGALEAMFGLSSDADLLTTLDSFRAKQTVDSEAYLLALLLATPRAHALEHIQRFNWPNRFATALERLAAAQADPAAVTEEVLGRMPAAERLAARALGARQRQLVDAFEALPQRRKLRGSDVLELGVPSGPLVGQLLAAVARARQAGQVDSFEAELELAHRLAPALTGTATPPESPDLE